MFLCLVKRSCSRQDSETGQAHQWISNTYPKRIERICADFEASFVDLVKEGPEETPATFLPSYVDISDLNSAFPWLGVVVEDDGRQSILHDGLPQYSPIGKGTLRMFVASTQFHYNLGSFRDQI
jgi:hypothetical protein